MKSHPGLSVIMGMPHDDGKGDDGYSDGKDEGPSFEEHKQAMRDACDEVFDALVSRNRDKFEEAFDTLLDLRENAPEAEPSKGDLGDEDEEDDGDELRL